MVSTQPVTKPYPSTLRAPTVREYSVNGITVVKNAKKLTRAKNIQEEIYQTPEMRHIISGAIICASMICKMLTAGYMGDHDKTWELISLKKILNIFYFYATIFSSHTASALKATTTTAAIIINQNQPPMPYIIPSIKLYTFTLCNAKV
jgi:hypothetical protein